MEELIFTAKDLRKQYFKIRKLERCYALDGFDMEIHRGDIYGFAGENGAGKTTLMRILTGRVRQTGGEITLFGKGGETGLGVQRGRVGALIETPALYPGMTAEENLKVLWLQQGLQEQECILEALEMAGLSGTAKKKVKDFSLGMKQRLGIAMALLGRKEFLVLDEPVNGLDPQGIVELRELLKKLNTQRGITILISSHLLGELNQLATRYGFIHKGKMAEQISAENLRKKCRKYLSIRVDNVRTAAAILQKQFPGLETEIITDSRVHLYGFSGNTTEVIRALLAGDIFVKEIKPECANLEQYYMSVIKGGSL
ncbi:ATP-binding cassette domain-containing protein [Lachnospiraceae bacterium]|nr:ATP-binding cassette domain-containing protein [Lachnospiraceae bacterium]